MAGAQIEVKYFNSFLLKKVSTTGTAAQGVIIYNGSFGVPSQSSTGGLQGGYPVISNQNNPNSWVIEESRIRGGYNNTSVDLGAKAYLIEEEPNGTRRFNTLIYSGIFNSRTGINRTNVFSVGTDITKSADPANGSIQKLFAEDTNLNIFQELKVSRALIDKDAIYTAEGGGAVTASNVVIGTIQPIIGKYGISQNPESFAIYGNRKYFADKNNNVILRLSGGSIEEISSYGMKDFFRDNLNFVNTSQGSGKILGAYDIYGSEYVCSLKFNTDSTRGEFRTLNFDERAQGWVSLFSYDPDQMFSLRNNFYSVKTFSVGGVQTAQLWRHYDDSVNRGNFYGVDNKTSITFVFNPNPTNSKTFKTIAYEGSNGWEVNSMVSDSTGALYNNNGSFILSEDTTSQIKSYSEGEYVLTEGSGAILTPPAAFSTTLTLDISTVTGVIRAGDSISGQGVVGGTTVVSYNTGTGALVASSFFNDVVVGGVLNFNGAVLRQDYNAAFGTTTPGLPRFHSGFNLKENKYSSNLLNNSTAANGEIIYGNSISGIKGYYSTVTMSTDSTTDLGGEKTLFSAESVYEMNNGY